jgi:alpha-galactosidase
MKSSILLRLGINRQTAGRRIIHCILWAALLGTGPVVCAQRIIQVTTRTNALVLQVSPDSTVNMIYLGVNLADAAEYQNVNAAYKQTEDYSRTLAAIYPAAGSRSLNEPAIAVTHTDGNNSLDLKYVSSKIKRIDDNVLLTSITLKDPVYQFQVEIFFKAYFEQDVVEQWAIIEHREKGAVVLHKYASANLYLKGDKFYLKQFHGNKMREMQPEEGLLMHGIKTIDSKLGTRANMFMSSSFTLSYSKPATEDEGSVLLATLAYSGNFRVDFEVDQQDNLRIISGINNYASDYVLQPNQSFETPALVYTFSNKGCGEASRRIQRWARKYKLLNGDDSRFTLLNNWEATEFNFDEAKLTDLIRDTKKLGVDLFLLDDGWFGNKYPRNDDRMGLGDWQENGQKLPHGIDSLIRKAETEKVSFGLWIEPEMISPKSELIEKHPDWAVRQPARKEYYYRNQLVLDLANPKVQEYIYNLVDGLFIQHKGLAYLKWDCNSIIYNAYSAYLGTRQSQFYVDYYRGFYQVLEKIRKKYPKVPMMLCSGGGGRVDYGALPYFTEYWPSDNTDPLERIFIQWGYSYFYPAVSSANHVTSWGKQSLKFRTDVAMMGKLGYDINVSKLTEQELRFTQQAVMEYDTFKNIIWQGDQYRLSDPNTDATASIMYMENGHGSGILFNYLVSDRYGKNTKLPVKLKGLDANKLYAVKELSLYPGTASTLPANLQLSGDFLMKIGINPDVNAKRTSVVLRLDVIN